MNKIIFNPTDPITELTVPCPKPAKQYIPKWYSDLESFHGGKPEVSSYYNGKANTTMKMCMPFADSFNMGYIQEAWQEVAITLIKNELTGLYDLEWFNATEPQMINMREQPEKNKFPIQDIFYPFEFTWNPVWVPELPKGYSVIITHPFNRTDLPFYTLTGVIDADGFTRQSSKNNLPFLLKKDFNGIIKKGTPLFQMIPILREEWKYIKSSYNEEKQIKILHDMRQYFWSGYKKLYWKKKSFN